MKQLFVCILVMCTGFCSISQQVFFKSAQSITKEQLQEFYASVTVQDSLILYNAPDYRLYAYNKNSGRPIWDYNLQRKSDIPPFVVQNDIWASGNNEVVQLDAATGKHIKTLGLSTLESSPLIKNDILYGTGIYDLGCLYAYDLKHDSVIWTKFISHGCARQPYYLANKIVANGEADNWLEVDYAGSMLDKSCDTAKDIFPSELPCVKKFIALTHDGKEIGGKLAEKIKGDDYYTPEIYYTASNTFILNNGKLYVLGNKLKVKSETDLNTLFDENTFYNAGPGKILKVLDNMIWLLVSDHLLVYNFQKKKPVKMIGLQAWTPHQAIIVNDKLWLVSRQDGLLYGLTMD